MTKYKKYYKFYRRCSILLKESFEFEFFEANSLRTDVQKRYFTFF